MASTITDKWKQGLLNDFWTSFHHLDSTKDSDFYYIGIGRSEEWPNETDTPPTPTPDHNTVAEFQGSLQAAKRVLDLSYVVPRYNWTPGSVFTAWTDKNHSDTSVGTLADIVGSYYVITDEHNVYVCLQQGKASDGSVRNSIYKPTSVAYDPFEAGPDGYVWKFLYNVGTYNSRRYLTSEWMPVERILDSNEGGEGYEELSASRQAQLAVQQAAVPGQILGMEILNSGSDYDSLNPPVISVHGECDDSAFAFAKIDNNGRLYEVVMKDSADSLYWKFGEGYGERTWVTVAGAGGAELRPIIHRDEGGFGNDPRKDLNSSALMYSVRIIGDEYKVFNVKNDFRQVGLIKNPLKDSATADTFTCDSDYKGVRGTALKKIYVNTGIYDDKTDLDNTVTGLTSGAKAILDYYDIYVDSDCCDPVNDVTNRVLMVHQNIETGFGDFVVGEAVQLSDGGGTATIIGHTDSNVPAMRYADFDGRSGEVLFVDNRLQIDRDEDQTEDIKIVIDL